MSDRHALLPTLFTMGWAGCSSSWGGCSSACEGVSGCGLWSPGPGRSESGTPGRVLVGRSGSTLSCFRALRHGLLCFVLTSVSSGVSPPYQALADPSEPAELVEGIAQFEAGQLDLARETLGALSENPRAQLYLGQLAFLNRDLKAAEGWLTAATEQAPRESDLHFWLGRTYGAQALEGSTLSRSLAARRSRSSFEEAVELDPDHLEARYGLLRFHLMAPRMLGGSRSEALAQAREIEKRDAYSGHLAWAAVHEAGEDWDAAERAYRQAAALEPAESDGPLRWVWLLQRQKKFEQAFSVLGDFLSHRPGFPGALYELGRTSAFSGLHTAQGREALESYLTHSPVGREPSLAQAHFHLGMIRRHERRNDLAVREFQRALELDPGLEEARRNLREAETADLE